MNPQTRPPTLAPGARIIVRHEEWLVKKIARTWSGARRIAVTGLSPLVRGRLALQQAQTRQTQASSQEKKFAYSDAGLY